MKHAPVALLFAITCVSCGAASSQEAPYAYPKFTRTFVGVAGVPPSEGGSGPAMSLALETGGRPFSGAFSTGFGLSSATEVSGRWTVVTPGLFAKVDLTYVFAHGSVWKDEPPDDFPFRIQLGGRIGLGVSESFRSRSDLPWSSPYMLIRPELESFVDIERPLPGTHRAYSIVFRGALDSAVNLSDVFRWSLAVGLNYGWGHG